uniref:Uncharacterized protein n=1 Tax=Moniliophthora roreri TaxID=221103 RepID=A0A0W0FXT1_MONRR
MLLTEGKLEHARPTDR